MEVVRVYTTQEWGATPVATRFSRHAAEGIVIHNTESANRPAYEGEQEEQAAFRVARAIQKYHRETMGWADTGQHFTVSRGGLILEGRHGTLRAAKSGLVVRGAHAGRRAGRQNAQWFGIEVEGKNLPEYAVTEAQWNALVELCAWLSFWGEFQSSQIEPHNRFSDTDCPGKLADHLDRLRKAVHMRKRQLMEAS
jgi:hypothetical protein